MRWKFALFSKAQFGFNGFVAPYRTKWLSSIATAQSDFYSPGGTILFTITAAGVDNINRLTGDITHTGDVMPLPAGLGFAHPDWVISDTFARQITGTPGPNAVVTRRDWLLSNQYAVGAVEADVDAQIALYRPDTLAWFKLDATPSEDFDYPPFPNGDVLDHRLPPAVVYTCPAEQISDVPDLRAASWYVFEPSNITGFFTPNIGGGFLGYFLKLVGWFALQGNYCEKTFYVDPAAAPVGTPGCVSGSGGCSGSIRIDPPPYMAGENAYKLIVPNCQCT
jgi:hypothetical protein